jgi:hypothetical protein
MEKGRSYKQKGKRVHLQDEHFVQFNSRTPYRVEEAPSQEQVSAEINPIEEIPRAKSKASLVVKYCARFIVEETRSPVFIRGRHVSEQAANDEIRFRRDAHNRRQQQRRFHDLPNAVVKVDQGAVFAPS